MSETLFKIRGKCSLIMNQANSQVGACIQSMSMHSTAKIFLDISAHSISKTGYFLFNLIVEASHYHCDKANYNKLWVLFSITIMLNN